MKVQFLGAAQTVTGSCYMIEACGKRFCIDCGMHQGNKAIEERNRNPRPYAPGNIDFILVTHAHIDHSGLLPLMVREGFSKPIYCTKATSELLDIMLQDSAHIQEMEAQWEAKKYSRRGLKNPPAALYTTEDALKTAGLLHPVAYHEDFEPAPGIKVTYYDAGHILGSGSLRLEVTEDDKTTSIIFSGDIGRPQALIVRDPESPPKADYIFMESTYGDRNHKDEDISDQELADAIAYSYSKGEKVIIPAFAVERTQEILYCLHILQSKGKLPADMPVFVDSPLAIRATEVFRRNRELFAEDVQKMLHQGDDPFELPNLRYTLDAAESQSINDYKGPAIIISASGMCNAGRVRHHLKHNIWKPGASIVFVGYQAVGTPGRKIVEKASKITLFGEDMDIAARIYTINGFSAHAGQDQLLSWLDPLVHDKANVVLVHGEEKETLAAIRAKAAEASETARRASEDARLNAAEAANAARLAAKGTAERAAELLQLEQLAAELQARSEEMQAQLLRTPRIVGPRRMLRAYPKLRHGKKLRTLPTLREMLHRAEQENKDDNKKPK